MTVVAGSEVDGLQVLPSAYRHGYTVEDMQHAYRNARALVDFDYRGEQQLMVIGASARGNLIELVIVPVDSPARIIHCNALQSNHYDYLR